MKLDEYSSQRLDAIYQQWQNFQNGQEVNPDIIKDYVLRSWVRCRDMGLDPYKKRSAEKVSDVEYTKIKTEFTPLIKSAKAVMSNIFSMLNASKSVMSLANVDGVILRTLPSVPAMQEIQNISRECYVGTAGISTCLVEKRPVELIGAEHWFRSVHDLVCVAAPIYNVNKDVVGILGITSHIDAFHPHTMGMILTAAGAISEQLRLRDLLGEQRAILSLIDEGVIMLAKSGHIKSITSKALDMLGLDDSPTGKTIQSVCTFLGCPPLFSTEFLHMNNEEAIIRMASGKRYPVIISCAVNEETDTIVLTLHEQKRMKELANRMTGAHAKYTFSDIQGNSPVLRKVIQQAELAAQNDITTLILGESGTGKELFAQAIHNASERKNKPFIVVNCGALPRDLVQSELFGYEDGAFTGAKKTGKMGKFELADSGTIFLDEIGEMPLDVQVNLLRMLQNKEISPLGSRETRRVNVRVIAATNRNLLESVQQNLFREDLYYRLNVFPIELPSLRERGSEDIYLLAQHFLKKIMQHRVGKKEFSQETISLLQHYNWPGNIRELENMVERAICLCEGQVIQPESFPQLLSADNRNIDSGEAAEPTRVMQPIFHSRQDSERSIILECLQENNGQVCNTARDLGISRASLYNKIKQYGIDVNRFRKYSHQNRTEIAPATPDDENSLGVQTILTKFSKEQLRDLSQLLQTLAN